MIKAIKQALIHWNNNYDKYHKMQHIYLVLTFGLTFLTGSFALLDSSIKQTSLFLVKILLGVFAVNALTMIISQAFLFDKIDQMTSKKSKK